MHFKEEAKHKQRDIERNREENDVGGFFPCAKQGKNNP